MALFTVSNLKELLGFARIWSDEPGKLLKQLGNRASGRPPRWSEVLMRVTRASFGEQAGLALLVKTEATTNLRAGLKRFFIKSFWLW